MPWESTAPGLRIKQVCRGDRSIRLMEIDSAFVEAEWCAKGHTGYVIDGTLEIRAGCG
jgi:hypothetical protein